MSKSRSGSDALRQLVVLDRLEVGPVSLSRRSLWAPYRVVRSDGTAETELRYTYEEDVFEPGQPESDNLAAVIAAQVALNYGLFCREIVFRGVFSETDRRFLAEMAANTAREIYVHKILKPNPFLTEAARQVPTVRRPSYLTARIRFADPPAPRFEGEGGEDRSRIAVLSSGGKESLLSFGLLRELGCEPHAMFVNESGRHWYTAVNGFRHLSETHPETTARVWTSADRVFSWMLRQLPIVRPDFHRLRADDYPIRLWTVAVFLFGILPLVRARRIGRIVIGDEYDTTRRKQFRGIPHYDGLYDQSRFFDNALSAYYRRKGWSLSQFSLVRPLSEILVQKTLGERYPALHRNQTSCHAAHFDRDRVRPCGRCEKCRRVIAMHVALGLDPASVGYDPDQVEACLRAVAREDIHQEAEGVSHLRWLLQASDRFPPGSEPAAARAHPEVMRLRFDDTRAPPHWAPRDLRRGAIAICLQHAEGALRKSGRRWIPCDPIHDAEYDRPFRHEAARRSGTRRGAPVPAKGERSPTPPAAAPAAPFPPTSPSKRDFALGDLTWPEAGKRLEEVDVALLPVGAIEQHGLHLPLDTDAWDAEHMCHEVARRCAQPRPLVLPLVPYGVSYHHDRYPGTISVSPETLAQLVYEIGMSAARHGITKLVMVNGHGGNVPALNLAAQKINRDAHIFTCVDSGETSDADVERVIDTRGDLHAGEIETSTCLATRPHLVDGGRAEPFVPRFSSRYLDFSSGYGVEWYAHTQRISPSGVLGDPTRASAEKGEKIWELMIRHLIEFVEALKSMTLAELHERRS